MMNITIHERPRQSGKTYSVSIEFLTSIYAGHNAFLILPSKICKQLVIDRIPELKKYTTRIFTEYQIFSCRGIMQLMRGQVQTNEITQPHRIDIFIDELELYEEAGLFKLLDVGNKVNATVGAYTTIVTRSRYNKFLSEIESLNYNCDVGNSSDICDNPYVCAGLIPNKKIKIYSKCRRAA